MELKFVAKDRSYNLSIPFNDKKRRITGYGFIRANKEKYEIYQNVKEKKEFVGIVDHVMSPIKDGTGISFIELIDTETGGCETYTWNEKEWYCYVVNNDGKTIDKI